MHSGNLALTLDSINWGMGSLSGSAFCFFEVFTRYFEKSKGISTKGFALRIENKNHEKYYINFNFIDFTY